MIRNIQFKMMVDANEKHRISQLANSKGISQADVMRLAFRDFEKKLQRETAVDPKPSQEQPAAVL
jgi:hypothetical protein